MATECEPMGPSRIDTFVDQYYIDSRTNTRNSSYGDSFKVPKYDLWMGFHTSVEVCRIMMAKPNLTDDPIWPAHKSGPYLIDEPTNPIGTEWTNGTNRFNGNDYRRPTCLVEDDDLSAVVVEGCNKLIPGTEKELKRRTKNSVVLGNHTEAPMRITLATYELATVKKEECINEMEKLMDNISNIYYGAWGYMQDRNVKFAWEWVERKLNVNVLEPSTYYNETCVLDDAEKAQDETGTWEDSATVVVVEEEEEEEDNESLGALGRVVEKWMLVELALIAFCVFI